MTASTVANHKAIRHAIYTADVSELGLCTLRGKFAYLPCRLNVRQPVQTVQLLAKIRSNVTVKTTAFAIPNESGETERSASHACSDDQVLMPLEDNYSSSDQDGEADASLSESGSGVFQTVEQLVNQASLLDKLKAVHLHVLASEQWNASRLKLCHKNYTESATNLIHYLALKCLDTNPHKDDLALISLLNLEMVNSSVLASLTTGIRLLESLQFKSVRIDENVSAGICTQQMLDQQKKGDFMVNAMKMKACSSKEMLLGPLRGGRCTHIMTTVGEEALESETLIADLIKAGTSIVRINCAHGNPESWSEIIRRVKRSSQMLEAPCRILMDLAGPKLRTGNLKPGPSVVKISPKKNATGNVIFPAQVWLSQKGGGTPPHLSPDAVLFIDGQKFFTEVKVGDTLRFFDARGKKRMLKISRVFHVFSGTGFMAECTRTAYVSSGTELYIKRKKGWFAVGQVIDVPARESFIRLRVGDLLTISRDGTCDQDNSYGHTSGAHRITCSSGYLFDAVKPGECIAFDDGKIWGVIKGTSISDIVVSITHAGPRGTKLGSQKSINIPDSNIRFDGVTSKDLVDLEFVASHADMVGVSFVRDTRDITVLRQELEKRKLQNLGIVLKIETKSGFEKLPLLLLEAMKSSNPLGVMIARGDLAVECGWERLADIQEEILSVSGAARVPVIWATQVLESLVKSGVPTEAINVPDSSSDCQYQSMCMEDKLLLELHSIGVYPETLPDLAEGEEAINQNVVELNESLYQQIQRKKKKLGKIDKAIENGRDAERRNIEHIAVDQLVQMAYKKRLACRGSNSSKSAVRKVSKQVALAFVKRTLDRCRKFEQTGSSCFNEPALQEVMFSAPPCSNEAKSVDCIGSGTASNTLNETSIHQAEARGPGAVSSAFERYDSSDALLAVHSSEHVVSKYGSMLNKGRKREVLIDDVVASASSRVTSTLDTIVGVRGKRTERDRDQSRESVRNMSSVSGAGRTSLDGSKGDRKMKAKPKQQNNHLSTSGNGFNARFTGPLLPPHGSSQLSANPSKMTEREASNIHQNSTKQADEPIDFAQLNELDPMEELGVSNELGGPQDLSSWLNFDEDGLQDHDSIGLEIPMDDLSDLKFAF